MKANINSMYEVSDSLVIEVLLEWAKNTNQEKKKVSFRGIIREIDEVCLLSLQSLRTHYVYKTWSEH